MQHTRLSGDSDVHIKVMRARLGATSEEIFSRKRAARVIRVNFWTAIITRAN